MGVIENRVSDFEVACLKALMPLLFRSVYGWTAGSLLDPLESLVIRGKDGSRLHVAVSKSSCFPIKGVVLLCHPFLKYGMTYFFKNDYHAWLNNAGYEVVSFNFKGFGGSTLGGCRFSDDVVSVFEWISTRYPDAAVHLLGTSFGGFHAIHAVADRRLPFKSLVFDSVPVNIDSFFGSGIQGFLMRWLSNSRWRFATGTVSLKKSLPIISQFHSLFLYGVEDEFIADKEKNQIGLLSKKIEIINYSGCGHLEIRKNHEKKYVIDIVNFLNRHAVSGDREI